MHRVRFFSDDTARVRLALAAAVLAAVLSACSGGGDSVNSAAPPGNPPPPPAVDTTPPTVSLSSPANGATIAGTITVSANASDNVGVVGVQFRLDGANLGAEDTTAPYSVSWNTTTATNGSHTLTAVARDAAGNIRTSTAVNVTVSNSAANAALSWDANTEPDLAGYRVYFGTTSGVYQQAKGSGIIVNLTNYTVTGLTSGTRYYFAVTAYDLSGNESAYSAEVFKDIP